VLWEGDSHRIDEDLVLEPAPGHTPGSAVLRVESGTDRALFVGDVIHTPLQMVEPDHDIRVSEDRAAAARSRRRVLEQAAATNSLVVPAHLGGAGGAEVVRSNGTFSIKRWAPLSEPIGFAFSRCAATSPVAHNLANLAFSLRSWISLARRLSPG